MTLFLSILFILLAINAILLIFSVNGRSIGFKRPIQKTTEGSIPKLFRADATKTEYKEAV